MRARDPTRYRNRAPSGLRPKAGPGRGPRWRKRGRLRPCAVPLPSWLFRSRPSLGPSRHAEKAPGDCFMALSGDALHIERVNSLRSIAAILGFLACAVAVIGMWMLPPQHSPFGRLNLED